MRALGSGDDVASGAWGKERKERDFIPPPHGKPAKKSNILCALKIVLSMVKTTRVTAFLFAALLCAARGASGPDAAHIELLAPSQGYVSGEGALKIAWATTGVPADSPPLKVVLMVNGLTAKVLAASSAEESMILDRLMDGPYRVHVFLGEYDEFEGLSNVRSSALVECWVDSAGVLGARPPSNPQAGMVEGFTAYAPATRPGAQRGRGPVVVFTYHCNRPDFVTLQVRSSVKLSVKKQ